MPNFSHGLLVHGSSGANLKRIQCSLDPCYKHNNLEKVNIKELLKTQDLHNFKKAHNWNSIHFAQPFT